MKLKNNEFIEYKNYIFKRQDNELKMFLGDLELGSMEYKEFKKDPFKHIEEFIDEYECET